MDKVKGITKQEHQAIHEQLLRIERNLASLRNGIMDCEMAIGLMRACMRNTEMMESWEKSNTMARNACNIGETNELPNPDN